MDNSFFEYRDKMGVDGGSDSEYIDDSIVESVTYSSKKKNHTVFVAESDESSCNDESMKDNIHAEKVSKSTALRSSVAEGHIIHGGEDDGSRRGSIKRHSQSQNNVIVSSSEDEEELSPELLPRRRPPPQKKSIDSNESLILRQTKKRMLFLDSDTDNSIVIQHDKNKKVACLKDTPLKIEGKKSDVNQSMDYVDDNFDGDDDKSDNVESDNDESDNDESEHKKSTVINSKYKKMVISSEDSADENKDPSPSKEVEKIYSQKNSRENSHNNRRKHDDDASQKSDDNFSGGEIDDDDGPDEDMMVMSRATRMSIMGVIPKDNDSDESDFIESDFSSRKSGESKSGSIEDLPEVSIHKTPEKSIASDDELPEVSIHGTPEKSVESDDDLPEVTIHQTPEKSVDHDVPKESKQNCTDKSTASDDDLPEVTINTSDSSKISCSPFSSPLHNITNRINLNDSPRKCDTHESRSKPIALNTKVTAFMDLTIDSKPKDLSNDSRVVDFRNIENHGAKDRRLDKSTSVVTKKEALYEDDDVTIIDSKPEIIALSSDEEDEMQADKKSPRVVKSPKVMPQKLKNEDHQYEKNSIKQYLAPPSYPGQVVYVKKHVRENELNKLMRLKEDLNSVRVLLEEMDMDTLPDGGSRLIQRLSSLEAEVRRQGDKVANMIVEPDVPSSADIAKDGFDKGLSWEDIQKASNAVQPREKQAMAKHMAERQLILDRLRDLHTSLASRPAEAALAQQPRLVKSTLMPYQRHALAWLRWRETQKPSAGILADDMGLGKTITMISLVASDRESNIDDEEDAEEGTSKGKTTRGGTLVVCPASLLQQWHDEVSQHCAPHALAVCLHHGAARHTHAVRLCSYDVVATTYNILQRDNDKNGVLMRIQWRRIILDEAHIVRNHKSATSVAVSNLKGKRRWCLTGTPVQNKDLDLFALLKFLRCSPFDDLQMWKKWIANKSVGGQERLSTIMRCILLRRTKMQLQEKGQLACLPPRDKHITQVTLTTEEMNVYQKVLVLSKTLFAQFLRQRAEKNSDATSFTAPAKDSEYEKMHKKMIALQGVKPVKSHEILVILLRLRQVCCHCGLIAAMLDEATADAPEEGASSDLLRELDKLSLEDKDRRVSKNHDQEDEANAPSEESAKADEAIRAVLSPNNPVFQLNRPSSKITAVMDCLKQNVFTNKGDKAVVVSQWTSVLRLVEQELNKQKVRSVTLSGDVPVTTRPHLITLVNDPNSDVKVLLLSLCAGGVGINLCGANHLLLLDPHWNPQLEEQAQDRVYRIGQTKHVHVYRFVCVDTVEQTICKLQDSKLKLAENVLTGARDNAASTLSIEDLKMLFNMGS